MTTGTADLPRFTDWEGHAKRRPLTEPTEPDAFAVAWLGRQPAPAGRPLRVLDVGCGRGGNVAWLCDAGYDAYGVDVDPEYIRNGRGYFQDRGLGERVRTLGPDGRYPFEDGWFDVVLSDQVLEHVADLPALAGEVFRVLRPGGVGLHIFPAKWRPIEPHLFAPFVHWLPAGGRARRAALSLAMRRGWSADHFRDRPHPERLAIFGDFLDGETYYRPVRTIEATFRDAGLVAEALQVAEEKISHRTSGWAPTVRRLAARSYQALRAVHMTTRRPD